MSSSQSHGFRKYLLNGCNQLRSLRAFSPGFICYLWTGHDPQMPVTQDPRHERVGLRRAPIGFVYANREIGFVYAHREIGFVYANELQAGTMRKQNSSTIPDLNRLNGKS
jgi:hypothetical protein